MALRSKTPVKRIWVVGEERNLYGWKAVFMSRMLEIMAERAR